VTKSFPVEERYSLVDQVRRSSRSVPANIAEAWRKRRYPAAFVSKLNDAEGEAAETQTHLEIALRCSFPDLRVAVSPRPRVSLRVPLDLRVPVSPCPHVSLCVILPLLLLWPASALGHTRGGEALGFTSGLLHPVSGLDHVLAMIAVGLWGAQLGAPAMWLLPVTFPMVMAFGGMLGLMGMKLPGIEVGIALSAIALGLAVCSEARPKLWIAALIVGFFAIFHGHAHGTELPPGANGILYSIGFVLATGTLHAVGISLGLIHRWPAGQTALRVAGAIVALAGVVFLWRAIS
jgi:urease accessory protein